MDLRTATPTEIDTALGKIYVKRQDAQSEYNRQMKFARDLEKGLAKYAAGDRRYSSYSQESLDGCLAKAKAAEQAARDAQAESEPLNEEFERRGGWTRFFAVTGGHVHASMDCPTCNKMGKPTTFGWLPEWSGRSEDEALEALVLQSAKTVLCTVCFPTAPVAWTTPRQEGCPGSGTWDYPRETARQGYRSGNYGICRHCGQRATITSTGKMRKHG